MKSKYIHKYIALPEQYGIFTVSDYKFKGNSSDSGTSLLINVNSTNPYVSVAL